MKNISNTITEKNIRISYLQNLQIQNKYTIFASISEKENLFEIAKIFLDTANLGKLQARILYSYIKNTNINIPNFYNFDNSLHNLKIAANGEHFEWTQLYYRFANIAKEENFYDISYHFNQFAQNTNKQALQYLKLINEVEKIYINKSQIY